jgi:hypothetical protein
MKKNELGNQLCHSSEISYKGNTVNASVVRKSSEKMFKSHFSRESIFEDKANTCDW